MQFISLRSRLSAAVLAGFSRDSSGAPKRVSLSKIGQISVDVSGIPSTPIVNQAQTAIQLFPSASVVVNNFNITPVLFAVSIANLPNSATIVDTTGLATPTPNSPGAFSPPSDVLQTVLQGLQVQLNGAQAPSTLDIILSLTDPADNAVYVFSLSGSNYGTSATWMVTETVTACVCLASCRVGAGPRSPTRRSAHPAWPSAGSR